MKYLGYILVVILIVLSCEKPESRNCFKGNGEIKSIEIALDSIQEFRLYKGIKYNFYQDSLRKLVIRGGGNVVNLISVDQSNYITEIHNDNKCHFLRANSLPLEIDIHYPSYSKIYSESSDSLIFMDTIISNLLDIQLRDGAGTLKLNVNVNQLNLTVSYGVGEYIVGGITNNARLVIQNLGRGNALNLTSNNLYIYQNSNADLLVNFENSIVKVDFYGNGDVKYIGIPLSLNINGSGEGEVVTY